MKTEALAKAGIKFEEKDGKLVIASFAQAAVDIKKGDKVRDYTGNEWEVIKESKNFKDVERWDKSGAAADHLKEFPNEPTMWVAVFHPERGNAVFVYGHEGVTKASVLANAGFKTEIQDGKTVVVGMIDQRPTALTINIMV